MSRGLFPRLGGCHVEGAALGRSARIYISLVIFFSCAAVAKFGHDYSGVNWAICASNRPLFENIWMRKVKAYADLRESRAAILQDTDKLDKMRGEDKPLHMRKLVYDLFEAHWHCENESRFGSGPYGIGDGPKFVCGLDVLANMEDCLIFSIGSNYDFEFELALNQAVPHCEIHIFDGTMDLSKRALPPEISKSSIHFHNWNIVTACSDQHNEHSGLHFVDGTKSSGKTSKFPSRCFKDTMRELQLEQTEKITWFKIDCEGCEFDLLPSIFQSVQVDQLFLEVHGTDFDRILKLFEDFDQAKLIPFHKEINQWCDGRRGSPWLCAEFSFITLEYAKAALKTFLTL